MRLSTAVRAVVSVLRRRPSDLLPFYLLGAAVPVIARVGIFAGVILGYLYLEVSGRLDAAREAIPSMETEVPDPDTEPEAFAEWSAEELTPLLESVFDAEAVVVVLAVLILTGLVTLAVSAILYAMVSAGQLAACDARLREERGLVAGIAGVRRYSLSFLGLYLLELVLWILVSVVVFGSILAVAVLVLAVDPTGLLALLVFALAAIVWLVIVLAIRALFAFAPVAVVVDDQGVFGSLRATVGFIRRSPVEAAFYYVVALGSTVALSTAIGILTLFEVFAVGGLLSALVLAPVLDLLKTSLYGGYRGILSPPAPVERSIHTQFRSGARRGWSETVGFVRTTPGTHLFVIATMVVGFWMGWVASGPLVGVVDTSIAARLEGHIPPAAALEFFANNWLVAFTTAFGGVALAIPALASIWFNGLFFGAVARLEVAPLELVAFVVPHGIFEIPAIVIAGALGVSLGVAFWRTWHGSIDREAFAEHLERAFWVAIGLGLLLALAGFIEGFVSPYYYRPFL